MELIHRIRHAIANLFRRGRMNAEMKEEMIHHLEMAVERNVATGMTPRDARCAARTEFGGMDQQQERVRDAWGTRITQDLARDFRHSVRALLKEKGFSFTVIATLALCVGANVVIFAVVDAILLRPLPFADAERLVITVNSYPGSGSPRSPCSISNYYARRENVASFESTSMYQTGGSAIFGEIGSPQRIARDRVSTEFFTTLGVSLARGRPFIEDEMLTSAARVMILTHEFWKNDLSGDPDVLDREIVVDGLKHRVVGVLQPGFRYLDSAARFYVPLTSTLRQRDISHRHWTQVNLIARLKPGSTLAEAQAQIDALDQAQLEVDPSAKFLREVGYHTNVYRLHADMVRTVRTTLLLLQGGVLSLLLIGGINITNLLLIRAHGRTKEFALRQALGAGRWHVARAIFLETVLFTSLGCILGLVVGAIGIRFLSSLGTNLLPLGANIIFDARVAVVALVASGLFGVVLAVPIVLVSLRSRLSGALQSETRGSTASRATQRVRHGFVVAQVALTFILLSGAGLLGLSLHKALSTSPGFNSDRVLTASLGLPESRYPEPANRLAFFERLRSELRNLPGVLHMGLSDGLPFARYRSQNTVTVEGVEPAPGDSIRTHLNLGTLGDYSSALGIPLIEGRFLEDADHGREQNVCVVDEAFAQNYWPGQSALGNRITFAGEITEENAITIVGVVGTVKQTDLTDTSPLGTVYRYFASSNMFIVVRSAMAPEVLGSALIKTVTALDPELLVDDIQVMKSRIDDSLVARRSPAVLAGVFAAVALIIAAIGTYGVLAYAVGQRRREIGVRMALGALPSQVRKQFLTLGFRILVAGITLGAVGALGAGKAMQSMLFNVVPFHAGVVFATAGVMILVVMFATLLPSHRASRVSPLEALRDE